MTLPDVHIQLLSVGRLMSRSFLDSEHVEDARISLKEKPGFEKYKPAVGRCKTCAHFKASDGIIQTGYCYVARTVNGPVPRHVPLDGSGFCHMHEVIF